MKKRSAIIMILLLMLLVMTACGSNEPATDESTGDSGEVTIVEDDEEYPISDESMDMDGCLVRINTEGLGTVARAEEGRTFKFNEEFPEQSTADNLKEGTKLIIGAKPDEGWKFVKWTLNGDDYSTDEQFNYTVTEDALFVAVFEADE